MAYANKDEIKTYFELNNDTPKQVAAKFNVKYRTLSHWIKSEKWQKGSAIKELKGEVVRNELLTKESFSVTNAAANKLKRQMLENLGVNASKVDNLCLEAMLEEASDKILLEAMSLNFIQKNMAQACLLAKNELLRMIELRNEAKPDAMIIAAAEKMANMFSNLQSSIYGKEPPKNVGVVDENTDFSKLSTAELKNLLKE